MIISKIASNVEQILHNYFRVFGESSKFIERLEEYFGNSVDDLKISSEVNEHGLWVNVCFTHDGDKHCIRNLLKDITPPSVRRMKSEYTRATSSFLSNLSFDYNFRRYVWVGLRRCILKSYERKLYIGQPRYVCGVKLVVSNIIHRGYFRPPEICWSFSDYDAHNTENISQFKSLLFA